MRGILFSVALHTLVVLTVALGLPWLTKPPANASRSFTVDIVRLSDITQTGKGEKPKPKTARKPDAERETTKKPVARDRSAEQRSVEPKPVEPKPLAPEPPKAAEAKPAVPELPRTAVEKPKPAAPAKTGTAERKTAPPAQSKPVEKAAPKPKSETPQRVEVDPRALERQAEKPKKKLPAKKPETRVAKPAAKPEKKPEMEAARPLPKPDRIKVAPKKPDAPVAKPKKKTETQVARPVPKPEKKKLPPKKPEAPVAKPKKKPEPKPQETAKKAEPKIERQIAALPRMRPPAKPRPKTAAKKPRKTVKKRPAKEDPLDSVFKTVGKLKKTAEQSDRDRTSARTTAGVKTSARSRPMTLSEIEAVRRQIQPCWNFPAGAQDAGSLRVLIRIWLNRDGSVRDAKVLDRERIDSNSKLRAAAEAGLRAVNNPRCSPLRLPPKKYDQWKVLTIDFDPSKLRTG